MDYNDELFVQSEETADIHKPEVEDGLFTEDD